MTAAGGDQGRQRCDFCNRPLPVPRQPSAGSPGALPSFRGQGRLGQHRLRCHQVSLTCHPGRGSSSPPSWVGASPAGTPMTPCTPGHLISSSCPHGATRTGCHRHHQQNSGGGKKERGKKKRSQPALACYARSTLEAAPVEIINESRFRDLSKWTGNKWVLIGHWRGRRQGGGGGFPARGMEGCEDPGVTRNLLQAA